MDPVASRLLFESEADLLRSLAMFNGGGRTIVSAEFPDLVVELPHPSGRLRRFRLRCDGWDELPPSVFSVDANGAVLMGEPVGGYWTTLNGMWGFCVPGTREYHQHHQENPWAQHRGNVTLAMIVGRLDRFYRISEG